jgi:hypothetical protein
MSKSCPQNIEDSVLENPNFDIKQLPIAYFNENKSSEELRDQFIKNTIRQSEECISDLAKYFFGDCNIELINKQIVLKVYNLTNKKYFIGFQSKENLLIVMRYIWIEYSKNLDFKIKEQITELNNMVVKDILPNIITNIEQHYGYIKDYQARENSKFKVNDLPVSTKMTRGTIELPSMSETFHNVYSDTNQTKCNRPVQKHQPSKKSNYSFNYEPLPENYGETSFGRLKSDLEINPGNCKITQDKDMYVNRISKSDNSYK